MEQASKNADYLLEAKVDTLDISSLNKLMVAIEAAIFDLPQDAPQRLDLFALQKVVEEAKTRKEREQYMDQKMAEFDRKKARIETWKRIKTCLSSQMKNIIGGNR